MPCVKEIKQTLREAREAGLKYIRLRDKARDYERRLTCGDKGRSDKEIQRISAGGGNLDGQYENGGIRKMAAERKKQKESKE